MALRHLFLIPAVLLILGGCSNRVVSLEPWFREDPATKGPKLRDGVWLSEDPDCKVETAKPAEQWPACANWFHLRANQSFRVQWSEETVGPSRRRTYDPWSETAQVIAPGEPLILQSDDCPMAAEKQAESVYVAGSPPASAPLLDASKPEPHHKYCYSGLRVIAADADGEITSLDAWPVFCGPFPKGGQDVTETPWPGLEVVGINCTARDEVALREAARRSLVLLQGSGLQVRARWIRSGYH